MKLKDLRLPDFAMLDGCQDPTLSGRTVILHIRSASVIEILRREDVVLNGDVLTKNFSYVNQWGIAERMVAALHYCATLDISADAELIKQEILIPAAKWYCDYATWEDNNIIREEGLNNE